MPNPKGNEATLTKYQPKWRSGATQTIRVPIALADRILDYAHRLDEGMAQPGIDKESLSQVIENLESLLDTPRNNFSASRRALLQETVSRLKSLVTSD
jgi:hypothetical protein